MVFGMPVVPLECVSQAIDSGSNSGFDSFSKFISPSAQHFQFDIGNIFKKIIDFDSFKRFSKLNFSRSRIN